MLSALIVLAIAALGGLTLAAIRLSGKPWPPVWTAHGHGLIAATGVGLLIYAAVTSELATLALVALAIFVLAAIGGLTLFLVFHQARKPLPVPLVLGHGLIAITGYVLLLADYFNLA